VPGPSAVDMVLQGCAGYLATGQGWLYLCAVRDGHSRRVIGYAFSDSLHTDIVETTLRRAVTIRDGTTAGVILYADRGCQYTSTPLADAAEDLGVLISVGHTGVCWERPDRKLLVDPEDRVLRPSPVRYPRPGDPRRHSLGRDCLQPPPAAQRPRPDPSGVVRAPVHHRGPKTRFTDVHQTGSTPLTRGMNRRRMESRLHTGSAQTAVPLTPVRRGRPVVLDRSAAPGTGPDRPGAGLRCLGEPTRARTSPRLLYPG
jgi:Integrase core domain